MVPGWNGGLASQGEYLLGTGAFVRCSSVCSVLTLGYRNRRHNWVSLLDHSRIPRLTASEVQSVETNMMVRHPFASFITVYLRISLGIRRVWPRKTLACICDRDLVRSSSQIQQTRRTGVVVINAGTYSPCAVFLKCLCFIFADIGMGDTGISSFHRR